MAILSGLGGLYVCLCVFPEVKKQYPGKRFDVDYDEKNDIYQITVHDKDGNNIIFTDTELFEPKGQM